MSWPPSVKRDENKELFIFLVIAERKAGDKSINKTCEPAAKRSSNSFFVFEDDEDSVNINNLEQEHCLESSIRQICLNYFLDVEEGLPMLQKNPNILAVFKKYYIALPSSAPVKRMYSFSGMILNPKWRRLGNSLYEKLTI